MVEPTRASWAIANYLRIRPLPRDGAVGVEYDIQNVVLDDSTRRSVIELAIPSDADPGLVHNNSSTGCLRYEFDEVFEPQASQEVIFNTIAKSKVLDVIDGVNCTIFAYGQTGSGKTYSMFGGESFQERGIIPRSVSLIFQTLRERQKVAEAHLRFKCTASFTEIYKETVYDLLDETKRSTPLESWATVQVFEAENGIVLRNLNVFEVASEAEALKLFFLGASNRITSSTAMNIVSSRSHAVVTLMVETESIKDSRTVYTSGKVNLVDLAGSERAYKMANSAESIKEAKAINLSLHFLEQVILALREHAGQAKGVASAPASAFVPYRNSVLTNMLRDSLGGNCRSSFLLTCSPERQHFEESVATCRFGQRCGEVKVRVSANSEIGLSDQLRDLAAKIKTVEKQLAAADDQREVLEALLREERAVRAVQTQLRALSSMEKATCTACVQDLLSSARAFVESQDVAQAGPGALKDASEDLVERSQDALYKAVEAMDKAVLVELSTALGGLVQSIFVEYQMSKKDQTARDRQAAAVAATEQQRRDYERRLRDLLLNLDDLSALPRLPDEVVGVLTTGAVFVKKDRMGRESPRRLALSSDLRSLSWEPIGAPHSTKQGHSEELSAFAGVDSEGAGMVLRPAPGSGGKALHLVYADWRAEVGPHEWLRALQYLVGKASKTR